MKNIFYIFSLVAMGFPMPGWAIPMTPSAESALAESGDGKLKTPDCILAGDQSKFIK